MPATDMTAASASPCFGEYECLLRSSDLSTDRADSHRPLLELTRELVGRRVVVRRVAPALSARSVAHSRLARGHVVLSVDGSPVTSLPHQWSPLPVRKAIRGHVVRFCDRRRAALEVFAQKEATHSAASLTFLLPCRDDVDGVFRSVHANLWRNELDAAWKTLSTLPVAFDPLALLFRLEIDLMRVLLSHDALFVKKARSTAAKTASLLEKLADLSSISPACRLLAKLALAEALLAKTLLDALHQTSTALLAAVANTRRAASIYCELETAATSNPFLPPSIARDVEDRVRFGLVVLRLCVALSDDHHAEWLSTMALLDVDPLTTLRGLLECVEPGCSGTNGFRRNYAALLLFHSGTTLLRRVKCCGKQRDELHRQLDVVRDRLLDRHQQSPLLQWAAGNVNQAVVLLAPTERAHLVDFDAGCRRLWRLEFDAAVSRLGAIAKCSSAPTRLRGLASLFLAVGYLLSPRPDKPDPKTEIVTPTTSMGQSTRVLLRAAHRLLAPAAASGDLEVASLRRRVDRLLGREDWWLWLLPVEVLYVACPGVRVSCHDRRQHEHVLRYLDAVADSADGVDEWTWLAEWRLLRAVVLFHLHAFENARTELASLQSLVVNKCNDGRTALASYVVPVAQCYQLQLLLLSSDLEMPADLDQWRCVLAKHEQCDYAYRYSIDGKLRALRQLTAQRFGKGGRRAKLYD